MSFDWEAKPGSFVHHAFVQGASAGDGSLCGRIFKDADSDWNERAWNCHHCSTAEHRIESGELVL